VSVEKPGSLDAAFDYLAEDLGIPTPLADLLSDNFYADIAERIPFAAAVARAVEDARAEKGDN
jgi:hypothetical protein